MLKFSAVIEVALESHILSIRSIRPLIGPLLFSHDQDATSNSFQKSSRYLLPPSSNQQNPSSSSLHYSTLPSISIQITRWPCSDQLCPALSPHPNDPLLPACLSSAASVLILSLSTPAQAKNSCVTSLPLTLDHPITGQQTGSGLQLSQRASPRTICSDYRKGESET